jgi:uncharacterized RDD family membrane protein YckC
MLENKSYAKFWDRAGAYLLDMIIIGVFSFGLNYLNFTIFKSFLIYLPIALIAILYKPYMESSYGSTFGKMLLNLKVVGENFEGINFKRSFMRSFILIFPAILFIPIYFMAFQDPSVINAADFVLAMQANYPTLGLIGNISFFIILIDLIVLLAKKERLRSLHDIIANTYVLKDLSNSENKTVANNI